MSLFLTLMSHENSPQDSFELSAVQNFDQFETEGMDLISLAKPQPVPRWQQWLTPLAETFMTYYEEFRQNVNSYYKDSIGWITLQLEILKSMHLDIYRDMTRN